MRARLPGRASVVAGDLLEQGEEEAVAGRVSMVVAGLARYAGRGHP